MYTTYTTCANCGGVQLISTIILFFFQQWYKVVLSVVKEPIYRCILHM
jgi:hypothetical protein